MNFVMITFLLLAPVMAATSGKLLLVSMDGFRWDYLDHVDTPNFDNFAKHGVRLPYMETSFVTKTFPSHFTMITGLYQESHGITDNNMYDPVFDDNFNMGTKDPRWWNGGEPLWVTAKNQGLKTGTYFWPGSEVEIRGVRPDYWFPYNDDIPYEERVDTVIDWFLNKNVKMATIYYPQPDATGHRFGADSPEVMAKVMEMDGILGYLVKQLKDSGLEGEVNVIVTSDHGMTNVDNVRRVIDLTDYLDMSKIQQIPSIGPLAQILPLEGEEVDTYLNLTGIPYLTVYMKEDIPEHFHYKNNRRILPIVALADEGWMITTDKERQARSPRIGMHGYDNRLPSMKPIFLARGPDFKVDFVSDPIEIVDIYPLACKLLNILPSANNGSLARASRLLKDDNIIFKRAMPFSGNKLIKALISPITDCHDHC